MHGGARDMAFLVVRSIDGAELARLSTVMSNAVYAERHLVFRQGDALVAQPFDERRLQLTGHPVVLAPSVQFNSGNDRTAFSVGGDTLAYRAARPFRLTWRDRQGVVQGYVGEPDAVFNPAIAPDATGRVALDLYDRSTKRFNIAILDDRGRLTRLTNGIEERFPVWSPDSQWIAFRDSSEHSLKRVRVDGSGRFETLASGALIPLDWSKDGKVLLYVDLSAQGLWALPLPTSGAAPGSPVRVADSTAGVGASAAFSPDGRWVAYMTSVGETGVWIQSFPDGAIKRRVTASGSHPVWGADSRELSYFAPDGTLMSMPITLDPAPAGGRPVALFKARSPSPSLYPHAYAASADGRRFLVTEMADDSDRITVILHWPALVR
jgi:hypothetical protein